MLAAALAVLAAAASAQAPAPADLPSAYAAARAAVPEGLGAVRGLPPFEDEDYPAPLSDDRDEAPSGFRPVSFGLYRSAQPERANFPWLARFGVRTVLDLRDPVSGALERWEAAKSGIRVENVPMSGLRAPSFDQVDRALAVLTDPRLERPLLVHCLHGQDRTGLVVAAYRTAVEGAAVETAVAEARSLGCCHTVTPDLGGFLRRYLRHRAARARRRR